MRRRVTIGEEFQPGLGDHFFQDSGILGGNQRIVVPGHDQAGLGDPVQALEGIVFLAGGELAQERIQGKQFDFTIFPAALATYFFMAVVCSETKGSKSLNPTPSMATTAFIWILIAYSLLSGSFMPGKENVGESKSAA